MLLHAPLCHLSPVRRLGRDTELWRRARWHRWRAENQGFGPQPTKKSKKLNGMSRSDEKRLSTPQSEKVLGESKPLFTNGETSSKDDESAPRLKTVSNLQQEKRSNGESFEEKLEAIKRSAEEKKRLEQEKMYGPIDYDGPEITQDSKTVSLPARIGIGIAVVVFGLIFAFGDILPSGETNFQKAGVTSTKERDEKNSAQLKEQLQGFLAILKDHPENLDAFEGAAVTYAQVGDFAKSESMLLELLEMLFDC